MTSQAVLEHEGLNLSGCVYHAGVTALALCSAQSTHREGVGNTQPFVWERLHRAPVPTGAGDAQVTTALLKFFVWF